MKFHKLNLLLTFIISLTGTNVFSQWNELPLTNFLSGQYFYDIEVVTENIIYTGGTGGYITKTVDGGLTWIDLALNTQQQWVKSIEFISADSGWVAMRANVSGIGCDIISTSDGGNTWSTTYSNNTSDAIVLNRVDGLIAYIGLENGEMKKTIDGGINWISIFPPTTSTIYKIQFIDQNIGFVRAGTNEILRTLDGGITWVANTSLYPVKSMHFLDENTGYIVDSDTWLGKTIDGGISFTRTYLGISNIKAFKINFFDDNNGILVGGLDCSSGTCSVTPLIFSTNDGGSTWMNNATPHPNENIGYFNIDFSPSGKPFICGNSGKVITKNITTSNENILDGQNKIVLYPNPTKGKASIQFGAYFSNIDLQIKNIMGQIIYTENFQHMDKVDIEVEGDAGIYFIEVSTNTKDKQIFKIVKE